jgi:hypothetical protein
LPPLLGRLKASRVEGIIEACARKSWSKRPAFHTLRAILEADATLQRASDKAKLLDRGSPLPLFCFALTNYSCIDALQQPAVMCDEKRK